MSQMVQKMASKALRKVEIWKIFRPPVQCSVCERNALGLNSVEFLSLILFHPPSHFITVLTARIESPTRKELKTHKTFHSPTQSRLSIHRAWPD